MARNTFRVNRAGVRALMNDPAVLAVLARKADAVQAAAQARAPRRTGAYAGAFAVRTERTDRTVVRVYNTAPYAAALEYGTSRTPPRRVLGSALDAARGA